MAELADALASGASPRKGVEVQVLLSAPEDLLLCNVGKYPYADMAELADALASGARLRKEVEVQVLLSAPFWIEKRDIRTLDVGISRFCYIQIKIAAARQKDVFQTWR